ncbi:MAG: serine hydrolase domain-containing protein [Acidobacteriota bacterium]
MSARMGRRLILCGFVLMSCSVCASRRTPPGADAGDADRPIAPIEEIIARFRSRIPPLMESKGLPALALALVDREGPLWVEGFGYIDDEHHVAVDENTLFSLQSTSKTVTATALLAAVRDGLVDLDTPITRYLPDFTVNSRFEEHPERRMTLRHLLGHRAGFTHEAPVGNNYAPAFPSFEAHVDSIQRTWLRYPVGLHHAYANLGVDLAGYILGKVSGKGFSRYVQETVLDPLGMTHSSFDWDTIRGVKNRAVGHWKLVEKMPLEFALIPSGGLYSSAKDMAAFLRFQLNDGRVDGKVLLDGALLAQMRTPSFAVPGQELGYGLGLRRYLRYGRPYYEHAGGGFGFKSHMSWYPDLGIGIVVLSNSMDQNLVHTVARDIIDAIAASTGLESNPPRPFADLEAASMGLPVARRLLGRYLGRGSRRIDVILEDSAVAVRFEGETLPLQLVSATEGFVAWERGKRELFRFALDDTGRPLYLLRVLYGWHYDFDQEPGGPPPGPDKASWDAYVGSYEVKMAGTLLEVAEVRRENGHLVFDDQRLTEYRPGLFFSVKGEALDLRGEIPTWRNIPLHRVEHEGQTGPASSSR